MIKNSRGVTITELMIATAVLSIAVLGLMSSFVGIQKALQGSKSVTLAANLGQEKMQILKQRVYYQILITTNPAYDPNFTPNVAYDPGYFPPETMLEGGINYTRYTMVQVAREDSGAIVILPPGTPDTGMKLVTVSIVWRAANEWKLLQLRTIVANPDTVTANAIFNGTVTNSATAATISGAVVNVAENLGWRDTSNGVGVYTINLSPGSFTLGVVVPGYFPMHRAVSIAANATQTQNFALVPMSSGSATGFPLWVNPNAVISQVVVSTPQVNQNNFEAQFVELYNPTASPITVGSGSAPNQIKLKINSGCSGANYVNCAGTTYGIKLNYLNTTIQPYSYYLIANTNTFTLNGIVSTADAVYADDANGFCTAAPLATYWNTASAPPRKLMAPTAHGSDFYITDSSDTVLDSFGIDHAANTSSLCETACIASAAGAAAGEQYVRINSTYTTSANLSTYGRAYDSGANRVDFTTSSAVVYPAYSTADPAKTLISGRPAINAIVSANDGISLSTRAYAVGSPPYAKFALTQVATGTWTMLISSGSWTLEHDTVTLAATGDIFTLPSTMTFLNTANSSGFIEGAVTSALGAAISPQIPLDPGGAGPVVYANTTNGRYMLRVTPGTVDIAANSGSGSSANYISISSLGVTVALGEIHSGVDFNLSQGGRISGFVTRDGTNPLPGIAVAVTDINGYARDTQVSGTDGRFTTINISTGFYVVEPALDEIESVSPSSAAVTVTSGGNIFASTFTVSGALGAITGSVTLAGSPLRTGALIVVTTATLAGSVPPALSSASLVGSPYYIASSQEDGTYRVEVRQSTTTTYRVYAYYISNGGTINALNTAGVSVLAGQTVSGTNFAW
ncbi:MAG: carboxypeptidase-like regulatory domain-containing protein [Elusimicrobia bacterium]|nr:carboxypeptidase-like regulatory domain-containing protein [Elusimicrobiota bacterium]